MSVTTTINAVVKLIARPDDRKILNVARWVAYANVTGDGSGGQYVVYITLPQIGTFYSGQHILWTLDNYYHEHTSAGAITALTVVEMDIMTGERSNLSPTYNQTYKYSMANPGAGPYTTPVGTMITDKRTFDVMFGYGVTPQIVVFATPNTAAHTFWFACCGRIIDEEQLP